MRQGTLFDDLYTEQEADTYTVDHNSTTELYDNQVGSVLKQELVTYFRNGSQVKKVTKTRVFVPSKTEHTTIEVF